MGKKAEPAETSTPARAADAKPEAVPVQAGGKDMKKKLMMALAIFGLVGVGAAGSTLVSKIMNKSDSGAKTEEATTSEQVVSEAAEGHKEEGGAKKAEGEGEGKGEGKEGAEAPSLTFDFKKGFTINLLEPSGRQFVQMSIQIQAATAESKTLIEKNEVRLRDATLMLVSSKTLAELQNQGGLDRLKNELRARYEGVLNKPDSIKDISYSDLMFVRQ